MTVVLEQPLEQEFIQELQKREIKEEPRNSLKWTPKLYKNIQKIVTAYCKNRQYTMDKYHIDIEDVVQNVCFTLFRWKNFNPEAYGKTIDSYIPYLVNQKISKGKKDYFRLRQNTTISLDDKLGNSMSGDAEMTIADVVADTNYKFEEFVEECLQRIPENHFFYVEDIKFETREVFRLLFNDYSGEEIAYAAGVDGKKFRKMKRILTKEFYSKDVKDLYHSLPSSLAFKPDYFIKHTKEQTQELELREYQLQEELSSPCITYKL